MERERMSALYTIGGALVGASLVRLTSADLAMWWSLLLGLTCIGCAAGRAALKGDPR